MVREPVHAGGRAGFWGLDSAAPLVAGTFVAARAAVDVALTTVDLVLGGAPAAYGLCRPPGPPRRARRCTAATASSTTRRSPPRPSSAATGERVAILDVDYHHGNGTQQIFWRRGDVRYVSIHADPDTDYPYFLGRADETGEGDGAGENLNLPLPPGTATRPTSSPSTARSRRSRAVPGSVVVVSLGFDTYGLDPIGSFALTTDVYHEIGRRTAALGRRLVILQEGGYHRPSLGENARAWLRGAEGRPFDPLPAGGFGPGGAVGRLGWRAADDAGPWTPLDWLTRSTELAARDADLAAIVARFGPPPLWDGEPGFPDAAPHRPRAAGLAGVGPRGLRPAPAVGRSADPGALPRALRRDAAGDRVQPPEGPLRPGAGGRRSNRARSTSTGWPASTTTPSTPALQAIPGIGPWTSTIYLLMVLGRPDVWPVGDIALATSVGEVKGLAAPARRGRDGDARRGLAAMAFRRGPAVLARLSRPSRPARLDRPRRAAADVPSRPAPGVPRCRARLTCPTHVQRIVDEIESEIGEEPGRPPATVIEGDGAGQPRRRTAGSRRPSARSSPRSARTPIGRAWSGRRSASTGCTPS